MTSTPTIFGGCMRLYPANHATPGPRWHVDEDHHTVGIDSTPGLAPEDGGPHVDPDSGYIHFNMLTKNPIIAATVAMDESLTAKGISGGVSNGTFLIRIRLYKVGVGPLDLRRADHWALVAGNFCNLWITLLQDVPDSA
jgi:hypothetical protein